MPTFAATMLDRILHVPSEREVQREKGNNSGDTAVQPYLENWLPYKWAGAPVSGVTEECLDDVQYTMST